MYTPQQVQAIFSSSQEPSRDFSCLTHDFACTKYAMLGCYRTAKASYKTYALVYVLQLATNTKRLRQNPKRQIPKLVLNYIKPVSFTAVDFMIMRRVLCLFHKYIGLKSCIQPHNKESLIIANILGGLYLGVQSRNRQIQIALYSINKTIETVYNMLIRRHPKARLPHGEVLLFSISIAIMSYYYFNNKELFRPAYEKVFSTIFKDI